MRRERPAGLLASPEQWPDGFVITEQPESTALVAPGDPYRDAERSLDPSVALEVAWTEDNWDARVVMVIGSMALPVLAMTAGILLGTAAAIAAGVATLAGCIWGCRQVWHAKRWLRVGSDGIRWSARSLLLRPVVHQLPAGEVAQLLVRDVTDRTGDNIWPKEEFRLYVRDRAGRDHALFGFPQPDNAWWLEQRIEHHLGIPDRQLPGEMPKSLPDKAE